MGFLVALCFSLSRGISWLKFVGQQYLNLACYFFRLDLKASVNGEWTGDGQLVWLVNKFICYILWQNDGLRNVCHSECTMPLWYFTFSISDGQDRNTFIEGLKVQDNWGGRGWEKRGRLASSFSNLLGRFLAGCGGAVWL